MEILNYREREILRLRYGLTDGYAYTLGRGRPDLLGHPRAGPADRIQGGPQAPAPVSLPRPVGFSGRRPDLRIAHDWLNRTRVGRNMPVVRPVQRGPSPARPASRGPARLRGVVFQIWVGGPYGSCVGWRWHRHERGSDMEIAVPTLIVGVFLGILPVVLGVLIGAWMTRGRAAAERAIRSETEQAQQMVAGLLQWAQAVKGDVSQYSIQMAHLSRQLQHSEPVLASGDAAPTEPPATGTLFTQMELSNQQLQERLHAAEAALERQTDQLGKYLSQARTDPLTGLPNRRAFDEEIARRLAEFERKGTPLSVVLIDIDRFKRLNDAYGHLAGDEVLKAVSERLRRCLRDIDTVARIGGEEFALLLPDTRGRDALLPAERAGWPWRVRRPPTTTTKSR